MTDRGDLQTPQDLLRKLQHDYERMKAQPSDSYRAFDFFMTAYHIKDWVGWADVEKYVVGKPEAATLIRTCGEIANNAKHSRKDRKAQLAGTRLEGAAFDPRAFQNSAFQTGTLMIDTGVELGQTDTLTLAKNVLEFWLSYPGLA